MDFVEQEIAAEPGLGPRELARRVRERFEVVVHPRSIEGALARRQERTR